MTIMLCKPLDYLLVPGDEQVSFSEDPHAKAIVALEAPYLTYPWVLSAEEEVELAPGPRIHRRLRKPYLAISLSYWGGRGWGMLYKALYESDEGLGPYWFRPLRTGGPNGAGWLDPVDGLFRFEIPA